MATIVRPGGKHLHVTVVAVTAHPVEAIALAQLNMLGDMRHSVQQVEYEDAREIFRDLCKTELQGAFEFVHFNIQMDGVTRAFQQQLTRTRLASYSAESLRFNEIGMQVLAGPGVGVLNEIDWVKEMELQMTYLERLYEDMIEAGVPVEDARGILPLNVLSKIGMSISYKSLIAMSRVRMCYQSQKGEWGEVFRAITQQISDIDPLLVEPFGAFCDKGMKCPFGSRLDRKCERNKS